MNDITINKTESNQELVIYPELENMDSPVHIPTFDFTLLSLDDQEPYYGRGGVKEYHEHHYDGKVAVRREFDYVADGVWIDFYWYKHDGEWGIHKRKFKKMNPQKIETKKRNDRIRTMDYLRSKARGTTLEPVIKIVFDHFSKEIESFEKNGDADFFNGLASYDGELNPYINAETTILHPDGTRNLLVKEIILFEIS